MGRGLAIIGVFCYYYAVAVAGSGREKEQTICDGDLKGRAGEMAKPAAVSSRLYGNVVWSDQVFVQVPKIFGMLKIERSYVHDNLYIQGLLTVSSSTVCAKIIAHSNKVSISDSRVGTTAHADAVEIINHSLTPSILEIKGQSLISGNVVFRGQPGTVLADEGVQIEGRIINLAH